MGRGMIHGGDFRALTGVKRRKMLQISGLARGHRTETAGLTKITSHKTDNPDSPCT